MGNITIRPLVQPRNPTLKLDEDLSSPPFTSVSQFLAGNASKTLASVGGFPRQTVGNHKAWTVFRFDDFAVQQYYQEVCKEITQHKYHDQSTGKKMGSKHVVKHEY